MKVTLKKICGDMELVIEAEGRDEKEVWPQLEFWTALPTAHPSGATDFQIKARPATTSAGKSVTYYEIVCPSTGQRFCLGQSTEGGLFPKGWENLPGQANSVASPAASTPNTKSNNVATFTAKPLTDKEMRFRAERIAAENRVTFDATSKTYTVQVNDKISYQVKPGPTCDCERFQVQAQADPRFKCEHIRAVALFVNSAQPSQRDELKLLIGDLLEAGISDTDIDNAIARVCDGMFAITELSAEQIAKAIRTLQGKYTNLAVQRQAAAQRFERATVPTLQFPK